MNIFTNFATKIWSLFGGGKLFLELFLKVRAFAWDRTNSTTRFTFFATSLSSLESSGIGSDYRQKFQKKKKKTHEFSCEFEILRSDANTFEVV